MATWEEIRDGFRRALDDVWGPGASSKLSVDVVDKPAGGTLATLATGTRDVYAIGRSLVRYATHYTLKVSPELLQKPDAFVRQVLLHEAIHIGYQRHDARFERVARDVGTYSSELGIETGGKYLVKYKPADAPKHARYAVVLETTDKDEAYRFAHGRKAGPGAYVVLH